MLYLLSINSYVRYYINKRNMKASYPSQPTSSTLNALFKITSDSFSLSAFSALLSKELSSLSSSMDPDFACLVAGLARSWSQIQCNKTADLTRESEARKQRISELLPYLEIFCTKFGIDKTLALIGVCLRQGDFFILEDEAQFLTPILPSSRVIRAAMGLCGILTLPVSFKRKFNEYPETFDDQLSFESSCENICQILKVNPIVPRLANLDNEALKLVETKFGFSSKAMAWFIVTLINLPLFVLEGMAVRELKKMIYLKELECELSNSQQPQPEVDYYDSLDFSDQLYDNPQAHASLPVSLSHFNELFEVLLFNNRTYTKMNYGNITSKECRQGSYACDDAKVKEIFGTQEEYYKDMAKAFYHNPNDPTIWSDKNELNFNLTWLNMSDRKKRKNTWEEIKKVLRKISNDPLITNKEKAGYSKITIGQLILFTTLMKIRQRVGSNYYAKFNEQQYQIYCVEMELLGVLFESQAMMHGALGEEYSRIRLYKVLSMALNAFIPNIWDHMVGPSLYDPEIYFPMREKFETPREIKAALEYCRSFDEKICLGTNLKLMNYVRFEELVVFLVKPSDAMDAESVARDISPYQKFTSAHPLTADKELIPYDPPAGDLILSNIDPKIIQNRKTGLVRPRDLCANKIEGKPGDATALAKAIDFLKMVDTAFLVEREKLDLLLDISNLGWDAYDSMQNYLKKAGYIINDKSQNMYKVLSGVVAKKDQQSFADSLTQILSAVMCRRDIPGVRNAILLLYGMLKKEDMRLLANLDYDLVEAIKASSYPTGLIDPKYLHKTPLPEPSKEIAANAFYVKVRHMQEEVLTLNNQGLTDTDIIPIAEALKRNPNIAKVYLSNFYNLTKHKGNNKIGEKGIAALANVLESNTAIATLDLGIFIILIMNSMGKSYWR